MLRIHAKCSAGSNVFSWTFSSTSGTAHCDAGSTATATVRSAPPGPVNAFSCMLYGVATEFGHAAPAVACARVAPTTEAVAQTTATAHAALNHRPCG